MEVDIVEDFECECKDTLQMRKVSALNSGSNRCENNHTRRQINVALDMESRKCLAASRNTLELISIQAKINCRRGNDFLIVEDQC